MYLCSVYPLETELYTSITGGLNSIIAVEVFIKIEIVSNEANRVSIGFLAHNNKLAFDCEIKR
jgi:hypothetical protein